MKKSKNKISGIGTTPGFSDRVPFYIHLDVTPVRNEARSSQTEMFVDGQLDRINMGEDTIETELLTEICENQDWLIQEQTIQIRELQDQLADYEQELYEKELYIQGGSN